VPSTSVIEADAKADDLPPPNRRRKLLIVVAAVVLAVAGAGFAGAYLWRHSAPEEAGAEAEAAPAHDAAAKSYIEVPSMTVNLRSSDGRAHMLRLRVMLVAASPERAGTLKAKMPLYLDMLQPFLRELRPEDLNGSAAVFRLKEEMIARANDAMGTGAVRDVLIQDLVQQ